MELKIGLIFHGLDLGSAGDIRKGKQYVKTTCRLCHVPGNCDKMAQASRQNKKVPDAVRKTVSGI